MTEGRLTVGIVTPHTAAGPEVELPAMTGGRLAPVLSRTGSSSDASTGPRPTAPATLTAPAAHAELLASIGADALDRAAVTFRTSTLGVVAHASTTTGYVIGHRGEAVLVERLSQRFDVPSVASCGAVAEALKTHDVAGSSWCTHPGSTTSSTSSVPPTSAARASTLW